MPQIEILKGIPASGKSTYAKARVLEAQANSIKRVNKDDLRSMLDAGRWSKGSESMVLDVRDQIILNAIRRGSDVIVDDTNLEPYHEERIRNLARELRNEEGIHVAVIVNDSFLSETVEDCISRDLARPNSVGDVVIKRMHKRAFPDMYKNKDWFPDPVLIQNNEVGDTIIVDLDGVLAINDSGRGWYDWDKVGDDSVNLPMLAVVGAFYQADSHICILTARDAKAMPDTEKWLASHGVPYDMLLYRKDGDMRKSGVVKRELIEERLINKYNIIAAFDDDPNVVQVYKDMGINVFHVPTRGNKGEDRV